MNKIKKNMRSVFLLILESCVISFIINICIEKILFCLISQNTFQ